MSLEDIVMWRIFIVTGESLDAAAGVAMRVWGQRPNPPANNVMFVSALGHPGSLITLEAEAVVAA
jgi:enamine deaminase RidA (YjgF/YER057c/UK114 family)